MTPDVPAQAPAVPGLVHRDLRGPGITRQRGPAGPAYLDPAGAPVTEPETLRRIAALAIPPAWTDVWIAPDPLGHIQATGTDRRGRTQYRYHQQRREQRDAQKFAHMLRFAGSLPGKHREVTVTDPAVRPTVAALAGSDNGLATLFCYARDGAWHPLHSRDVSGYIAARAGAHFTAKEFRTWNATVLMALVLANAAPSPTPRGRTAVIAASIREVAAWLGDTPAVARGSYVDPGLISRYESLGELPGIPVVPAVLPAPPPAEAAVAALLVTPPG